MTATRLRLTVLGCAGSFPGPDSPASGYLVEAVDGDTSYRLIVDLGSGALGPLQRHLAPQDVDSVVLSHLHPDHMMDLCGMYVIRKYHPSGPQGQLDVYGPGGVATRLAQAYGIDDPEGMTHEYRFTEWADGGAYEIGPLEVRVVRVDHPVEAYAIRIAYAGRVLVYSGDTGPTQALVDVARDADVLLCEASFVETDDNPRHLHLTGAQAGEHADAAGVGRLLVTHIPAWIDRNVIEAEAKRTYDGPIHLVSSGETFTV